MADAKDYAPDVQKYVETVDEAALKGIVRHCGIALRSRDSSLVSGGDPAEVARIRDGFVTKKLGQTAPAAELDAAITAVLARMKGDRTKSRVTVYYLLAEHFGKLDAFA